MCGQERQNWYDLHDPPTGFLAAFNVLCVTLKICVEPVSGLARLLLCIYSTRYDCMIDAVLGLFPLYGKSHESVAYNRQAETEGSIKMKVYKSYLVTYYLSNLVCYILFFCQAPGIPGEYEVRYSPKSLQGSYTGMKGDTYIAVARFTVETV